MKVRHKAWQHTWHWQYADCKVARLEELVHNMIRLILGAPPDLQNMIRFAGNQQHKCESASKVVEAKHRTSLL